MSKPQVLTQDQERIGELTSGNKIAIHFEATVRTGAKRECQVRIEFENPASDQDLREALRCVVRLSEVENAMRVETIQKVAAAAGRVQ